MKIYLDSIGCRLNQSEIEKFARQFRAAGHVIVDNAAEADYIVVNTCAVTSEAASDSRQKIRQAARVTQGEVVVTGCWSTLDAAGARALPKVRQVVANENKDHLVSALLGIPAETFDLEPVTRQPLPGAHLRTRAFIKVQDGCDNHCTFCITRIARGRGRSRSQAEVLADIHAALEGGAQEVVLTGVHLGSWGQDFSPSSHLYSLVESVLEQTTVPRLRLSSLEPWDLDENFFSLWSSERYGSRLCRHLHLPLQSGAADTLRRMARKTTPASFAALVDAARAISPEMAITTDIIVGFPGETEAEFHASLEFVRRMNFAHGHVFTYSPRPGTAAARMRGQVPKETRKRRSAEMRAVIGESAERYRQQFIGAELDALWEAAGSYGPEGWRLYGLTDNYLRVSVVAPEKLWNQLSRIRLISDTGSELAGEIISG